MPYQINESKAMNQYIEKRSVSAEMNDSVNIISQAYKSGTCSRRKVARLVKKMGERRNIILNNPPDKIKGLNVSQTVECVLENERVSFSSFTYMMGKNRSRIVIGKFPITITNHALTRYFERTQETDFLIEYHPTLAFYCLFSLMHTQGYLTGMDVVIPCESGLLLGSITGKVDLQFDIYDAITKTFVSNERKSIIEIKQPAAEIVAKTFISHGEMFENQTALWEKMMQFYDDNREIIDVVIAMFITPDTLLREDPAKTKILESIAMVLVDDISEVFNNAQK